jgi:hypothetical protein
VDDERTRYVGATLGPLGAVPAFSVAFRFSAIHNEKLEIGNSYKLCAEYCLQFNSYTHGDATNFCFIFVKLNVDKMCRLLKQEVPHTSKIR